jgi:hypothetical protein
VGRDERKWSDGLPSRYPDMLARWWLHVGGYMTYEEEIVDAKSMSPREDRQPPPSVAPTWGATLIERLPPRAHRLVALLAQVRRLLAPALPVVVVGLVLMLSAVVYYNEQHYYTKPGYKGVAAFADIGTRLADHMGLQALAMNNNPIGFDGQFYYAIALDPSQPIICAEIPRPSDCALDPAFGEVRAERILYAYTAGLLTFGSSHLLPYTLLLVNFLAILLTTWLVGSICVASGASVWLGAAAGLFCGEVLGFLRDLADPFAVLWVVLAVYLLRKEHYLGSALAVAAALLTREQLILTIPLLFLPALAERRWRTLAFSLLIGLGPFLGWQIALRIMWGKWGLSSGDTVGAGLGGGSSPLPFLGLWQKHTNPDFWLIVAFVVIPVLLAVMISLIHIWQSGPRHLLHDPVPLIVILYTLLLSVTSWVLWQDMWTPGRLADVAVVLGVIVVGGLPMPSLRASYATLLSVTGMAGLILVIR